MTSLEAGAGAVESLGPPAAARARQIPAPGQRWIHGGRECARSLCAACFSAAWSARVYGADRWRVLVGLVLTHPGHRHFGRGCHSRGLPVAGFRVRPMDTILACVDLAGAASLSRVEGLSQVEGDVRRREGCPPIRRSLVEDVHYASGPSAGT